MKPYFIHKSRNSKTKDFFSTFFECFLLILLGSFFIFCGILSVSSAMYVSDKYIYKKHKYYNYYRPDTIEVYIHDTVYVDTLYFVMKDSASYKNFIKRFKNKK